MGWNGESGCENYLNQLGAKKNPIGKVATRMNKKNSSSPRERKALRFALPRAYDTPPLHLHMFQEDVQMMGHFSRTQRDEGQTLRLEGTEVERQKADALCASIAGGSHRWPEENIAGAIEDVVLNLTYHGTALFEIAQDPDTSMPSLVSFDPDYVWTLPFFYLQVPPSDTWQYLEQKYALLKKDAVWRVEMPRELGGARGFRLILKEMSVWSSLGPEFLKEDLERRQLPKDFVFADYRRTHQVQLFQATSRWGWGARDWSLEYVTEYYQFHRHLTFKWAQAVLREHLVKEFNSLFHRLGISTQIAMEGFSSPEDILKVRNQMRAGSLDFAAATKAIH